MKDQAKTKKQLLSEIEELRRRIAELEKSEIKHEQMEDALKESQALLRATIESLPFDFFAIDASGRYVVQNSTCRERWGDVIGKRPEDIAGDEDNLALWKENNARAFAGEVVTGEVELKVNGDRGFYYNIISPIQYGDRIQGILGVNIDITERKHAEEALHRAHKRVQERSKDLLEVNKQLEQEIENRKQVEK